MKAPQLFCGVLALALAAGGCHRQVSQADVKQTASDAAAKIKVESAQARDQLADVWLSTKIHSKFVGDRDIEARDVSVSTKDGVVTLKGRVLNEPMRQLAIAIAKDTDGVKQVVNQLDVEIAGPVAPSRAQNGATPGAVATTGSSSPTAAGPDDGRITSSIQSKYFISDRLKGRRVNVTSSGGVVTLNGDVADETERAEALLLARTTDGVTRVEDSLTVTAASPAAAAAPAAPSPASPVADGDDSLGARVKTQLSSDARVKGAAIDVTAKNGVVLLQGTVPSTAAKQRALTVARGTDGVTQVVDRLHVGKGSK
ncbi:MAG TPA: BON domain-containing protein [Vicinamibacterales bacterium]|nr:BON domain-containing protein [Vicinamibacterales bacterium]